MNMNDPLTSDKSSPDVYKYEKNEVARQKKKNIEYYLWKYFKFSIIHGVIFVHRKLS